MAKKRRKATFTKETAAQNRAIIRRAKVLLADVDLDLDTVTVPKDHPVVKGMIQKEFPGVNDVRIWARMAQAIRQLRYEKHHTLD